MELLEQGMTEGNFVRRAPRLHDMGGKSGGICQRGECDPGMLLFCGVFQPKLMDFVGGSSEISLNNLLKPVDWRFS